MRRMRSLRRRTASSPRKMRRSCCSSRSCCSPRPRGPRAPRRRGRIPHHLAAPIVRQTGELPIAPCTGLPVSLESSTLCGSLYGEAAGVGSRLAAASRTQQRAWDRLWKTQTFAAALRSRSQLADGEGETPLRRCSACGLAMCKLCNMQCSTAAVVVTGVILWYLHYVMCVSHVSAVLRSGLLFLYRVSRVLCGGYSRQYG
jgi:hypothetical protein